MNSLEQEEVVIEGTPSLSSPERCVGQDDDAPSTVMKDQMGRVCGDCVNGLNCLLLYWRVERERERERERVGLNDQEASLYLVDVPSFNTVGYPYYSDI